MRRLYSLFAAAAMVLATVGVGQLGDARAQDASSETGNATVDGVEFTFVAGDVIAQGQLTTDANGNAACVMPETTIGGSGDASIGEISIQAQVTEDCQFVITSINKTSTGSVGEMSIEASRVSGGWYDQYDCCGLMLSESYVEIYYEDNGSSVYATSQYTHCRNALDGWYGVWSAQDWSPGGPSSVSIWKMCEFAFIGGSYDHTLEVDVYSWPGNAWDVYCSHWGSLVPGANMDCGGNHW